MKVGLTEVCVGEDKFGCVSARRRNPPVKMEYRIPRLEVWSVFTGAKPNTLSGSAREIVVVICGDDAYGGVVLRDFEQRLMER